LNYQVTKYYIKTKHNNTIHSDGQGRGVLKFWSYFVFSFHLQSPKSPAHW
jgi:hypothetical protein